MYKPCTDYLNQLQIYPNCNISTKHIKRSYNYAEYLNYNYSYFVKTPRGYAEKR